MAERNYRLWSPIDERKLLRFLNRHRHLMWEQRAAKYCSEVNVGRTIESLRSKYAQLRRGIRRLRVIYRSRSYLSPLTAQFIHRWQERALNDLSAMQVPDPLVLELKPRSQDILAMLRLIERHQRDRP
ncbi:hypothetical protein ETB97_012799 [Aspergillus alliaceus]|uniref:Uncharacterized protein n=1 Tax=Petromyces alliaceus TaxID=209559 RepID=A0A8H6A6N2_PETAA|nr:hypothetical protein ETB97_012799 [Aspergillus burnettii]